MARLARAMDIQPPSLYKCYPSLLAVYDALFRPGQLANLEALRDGYHPSAEAFAPAMQIIDLLRGALQDAVARSQVHPDAATDAGLELLSIMHFGIISQHLANDPDSDWEHGRYTRRHREILSLFVNAYPPRT